MALDDVPRQAGGAMDTFLNAGKKPKKRPLRRRQSATPAESPSSKRGGSLVGALEAAQAEAATDADPGDTADKQDQLD